ncbi:MAG: hypothetical protein ACRYFZ_06250 [Janthinobacterium lividum]
MIRVQKTILAPEWLRLHGPDSRVALENAYDDDPLACQQAGTAVLKPKRTIYAYKAVKKQLRADQHLKCAYCETKFTHSSPGDVEHYRPKAGYQQVATEPLRGPGYYWLAYDWANLLFACEECNRVYKRNQFPLRVAADRALNHQADLHQEAPLVLNPATCPNPEAHLTFEQETAVGLTEEGEATWRVCGLNRPDLLDARRDYLELVQDQVFLATILDANPPVLDLQVLVALYGSEEKLSQQISAAQLNYQKLARADAPFAGMVRANFPLKPTS